jgi:two-component system phosphate regulon sensor histidine kinase PhoR
LDLAQIESGQAPLKLLPENLRALVNKTMARFALQAERKNIIVRATVGEELRALVDAGNFDKVLGNLIHNALKFTPPRGRVTVDARAVDDLLEIRVADTGVGIPARDLPRIFERFYKVDRARSREERGTGLGLAIAKHIVEAHGGRIWVESIEGAGATFYFTVPRA